MKIIKIQFPSSPKIYSYLLNAGSVVFPKKGDKIYLPEGCSKNNKFMTEVLIHSIEEVRYLPKNITSSITVLNLKLECNVFKLNSVSKNTLETGISNFYDLSLSQNLLLIKKAFKNAFRLAEEKARERRNKNGN